MLPVRGEEPLVILEGTLPRPAPSGPLRAAHPHPSRFVATSSPHNNDLPGYLLSTRQSTSLYHPHSPVRRAGDYSREGIDRGSSTDINWNQPTICPGLRAAVGASTAPESGETAVSTAGLLTSTPTHRSAHQRLRCGAAAPLANETQC